MRITVGDILQIFTFLIIVGVWVGGINGLSEDAKEWKKELSQDAKEWKTEMSEDAKEWKKEMRVWMDDAVKERRTIMTKLDTNNQRISKIETYLEIKDPAYVPLTGFQQIVH